MPNDEFTVSLSPAADRRNHVIPTSRAPEANNVR
jgi:hypothetical protein